MNTALHGIRLLIAGFAREVFAPCASNSVNHSVNAVLNVKVTFSLPSISQNFELRWVFLQLLDEVMNRTMGGVAPHDVGEPINPNIDGVIMRKGGRQSFACKLTGAIKTYGK